MHQNQQCICSVHTFPARLSARDWQGTLGSSNSVPCCVCPSSHLLPPPKTLQIFTITPYSNPKLLQTHNTFKISHLLSQWLRSSIKEKQDKKGWRSNLHGSSWEWDVLYLDRGRCTMRNRTMQHSGSKVRTATSASLQDSGGIALECKAQHVWLHEQTVACMLLPGHIQPLGKKLLPTARLATWKEHQLQDWLQPGPNPAPHISGSLAPHFACPLAVKCSLATCLQGPSGRWMSKGVKSMCTN